MDTVLDDDDRRLIAALQVRPRASWTELGAVLGPSPLTLALRWARLSAAGVAWLTAAPNLEIATIDVTAGSRELVLTVGGPI
jgi:AsnC-type helix-turn-helix domain